MDTVIENAEAQLRIPDIGEFWRGGVYAGIIGGIDGKPDYHLIHAPMENELIDQTWDKAVDSATAPINGFIDWSLPDRRESRLLAINTPDGFSQDHWYWTATQGSGSTDVAWLQDFLDGDQDHDRKSYEGRARAVRRDLIIQ